MKELKKELIINLFNNKFNLESYVNFIQEIFKCQVKYSKNLEFSPKVKGKFGSVVKSFLNLGKYTDKNRKTLILAVVELWDEDCFIARSRTIQRNFVKDYFLKGGADSALVVFYNKESHDWRLSFIKLDYSYKNLKLEEDITPAKRVSFLLGENEKTYTAVERFKSLLLNTNDSITIEDLEEIFNIEVVTKEFFEEYCDLYLRIKKELDKQEGFKKVEIATDIKSEDFAKKLMRQLVFLYFLQKKGWLGVEVNPKYINKEKAESLLSNKTYECSNVFDKVYYINKDVYIRDDEKIYNLSDKEINCLNNIFINTKYEGKWGSGDKSFIRSMFKKANDNNYNFFKDYLEPIFYNALNDKRGESTYFKYLNCKMPFLNSDLFQPISENYDYRNAEFVINNDLFSNKKKNKQGYIGDGILDVFDRYTFTIKENEPLEKEVAVDPEMLGKVFENLLDITDRKKKGAFYTPREIVHYMCQESLINYLSTKVNLNYDEAEALIRYGDIINDIDYNVDSISKGQFKMPKNIRLQASKIDYALENVKIADPAVGSGAFPLGMVNEIVKARINLTYYMMDNLDAVSIHSGDIKGRTLYDLKLKTIKRCIHAVDIERSAVDITKLRLWLSLVVEENEFNKIKPLPNLDYNIIVGNSLIEERTNSKPYFLWRLNFARVFREKGGFDIVIGNPPYIKIQNLSKEESKTLKNTFKSATGKFDIYVLFIEKSFELINTKGIISFIHPHRFLNVDYGKGIRKFLIDKHGVKDIINFGTEQIFETATTYTGIFFYSNENEYIKVSEAKSKQLFDREILNISYEDLDEEQWVFRSQTESKLLKKLKNQPVKMDDIFEGIYQGVITVGDDIFVLEGSVNNGIFTGYSKALEQNVIIEAEIMKELLKGENIRRYQQPKTKNYIFYPHIIINGKTQPIEEETLIEKYPLGYKYISNFKEYLINKKIKYKTNPQYWYTLHRAREKRIFETEKILTPQLQNYPNFCIDINNCCTDAGGYIMIKKDNKINIKLLLGIMNSSLLWFFIKNTSTAFNNDYYYFKTQYLNKFTFPNVFPDKLCNEIIKLVEQLIEYKKSIEHYEEIAFLENKIDFLVYKLFSITDEEIKIIEKTKMEVLKKW